jgi:hypothetical protein
LEVPALYSVKFILMLVIRFDVFQLDEKHVVAVARGPVLDAVGTFREAAFDTKRVHPSKSALFGGAGLPFAQLPDVQARSVSDLIL